MVVLKTTDVLVQLVGTAATTEAVMVGASVVVHAVVLQATALSAGESSRESIAVGAVHARLEAEGTEAVSAHSLHGPVRRNTW